jgi:iron(III) transport system permease protein
MTFICGYPSRLQLRGWGGTVSFLNVKVRALTIERNANSRAVRSRRNAGGLAPSPAALWQNSLLLFVALCVAVPLTFLVLGSFSTARLPGEFSLSALSVKNYTSVWLDPATLGLFYNTAAYVLIATALGITIAAILAYLVERTNIPGKAWLYASIPLTLALPGLVQAMAYAVLFSPRAGFVNRWAMNLLGLERAPLDIYTLGGMAFVEGLRLVPTAFLMLVPLLRSMDPSLEEAASVAGASPLRTMRRITLLLMAPGVVAVTIFQAMTALESFEVPGILGMSVGLHVFSTKIYVIMREIETVPKFGEANALGMLYLAVGLATAYVYWRIIQKSERYAVVTGKGYRPRIADLGVWRYPAAGAGVFYLVIAVLLPFLVMLYLSLVPVIQVPSWETLGRLTLRNYEQIFAYPRFLRTLANTLAMVAGAATATTVLSFAIALVVVRTRFWGRRLLDQLAFVPHTIPGIVAGLAFFWLFVMLDLYGTVLSIAVGFTVLLISYGTRTMNAALLQVHKDLEDAAKTAGAPPWRVMLRVFLPLMAPTFIGLWIWVVLLTVRIASLPLVLNQGAGNEVLAVMMWNMWDTGEFEAVGAMSVLLMVVLFLLVLALRPLGFGRAGAARVPL